MKRFSNYADDLGLTSITSRPFRIHVLLPGLLVAFLLFFFSVRLLGAATDDLSESIPHYHWTVIGNDLSALGAGWLGALVMMNVL